MSAADETGPVSHGGRAARPRPSAVRLSGWGHVSSVSATLAHASDLDDLRRALTFIRAAGRPRPSRLRCAIARGMGRSYGDAAQLDGGVVLDTTRLRHYELDAASGVLRTQAGVTIGQLLPDLITRGWILPVVPGTQYVTIGGAIASHIHGKNHRVTGTFSRHVRTLRLLTADQELCELHPDDALFQATAGGMGLTGVIFSAEIQLQAVAGPMLSVDSERVDSLDAVFAALCAPGGPYRVAWPDLLCGCGHVRGIVTRA